MVATYFVFAYVGLTIPVIGVGIASQYEGDFRAVLVCAIALAALSAVSMAGIHRASSRSAWHGDFLMRDSGQMSGISA